MTPEQAAAVRWPTQSKPKSKPSETSASGTVTFRRADVCWPRKDLAPWRTFTRFNSDHRRAESVWRACACAHWAPILDHRSVAHGGQPRFMSSSSRSGRFYISLSDSSGCCQATGSSGFKALFRSCGPIIAGQIAYENLFFFSAIYVVAVNGGRAGAGDCDRPARSGASRSGARSFSIPSLSLSL